MKYVFIGMGRNFGNILFVDGVNEKGLLCVMLYFLGFVGYEKVEWEGIFYIVFYEFVIWILLNCGFFEDVKEKFGFLMIVEKKLMLLDMVLFFYWILLDCMGGCIVIELILEGMKVYDNKFGVMINSFEFFWYVINLCYYIGIRLQ